MVKIFRLNIKITLLIFAFLDLFCVGMGMGVPIFNILFGFVIGWYIVRRVTLQEENHNNILKNIFKYTIITSLFTFVVMVILWGPAVKLLFTPGYDFKNFGIPLILFDPKASFIGWLGLMVVISPFLQLLTTIFAAYLTLLMWSKKGPLKKYILKDDNMSSDYSLKFDLSPYEALGGFARQAAKEENLSNKGDWLNHFINGLDGLGARVLGVKAHYYQIHSWDLVELVIQSGIPYNMIELSLYQMTEYHLSTILFNMDSAIECMVYMLNALGYGANSTQFMKVTDETKLAYIFPWNILGKQRKDVKTESVEGYNNYFPSLKSHWCENEDLIRKIADQHNVSKHRRSIFSGGKRRMDPPPDFFKKFGIEDKTEQLVLSPFAEITLPLQPKLPWNKQDPKGSVKLEEIARRFQAFIDISGVKALEDARYNIKLK